jgi:carbamoyltransferase
MPSSKLKNILGINMGHDGGCALSIDGQIVASMTEERLIRVKYAYGWLNSLKFCLDEGKMKLKDIDLVVFSDYSDKIKNGFDGGLSLFGFSSNKCTNVNHHLSHACSAFFTSPFKNSLVFVFDARGNNNSTESVYLAKGNEIKKIAGNPIHNYEKGVVAAYQAFTTYFGWHQNNAGKTMGLSSYGDSKKYSKYPLFTKHSNGLYSNNLSSHTALGVEEFCSKHALKVPSKYLGDPLKYADMAAWIQAEFERVVLDIIDKYQKETGVKNLCLAGGGALNTVCNTKILSSLDIERLHIFPSAGDSGQSIGNVLYGHYIFGDNKRKELNFWRSDYRCKKYTDNQVEGVLKRINQLTSLIIPKSRPYRFRKVKNIEYETAKLIVDGKIIAWFQGGSEMGPRALGHRSILCDPRPKNMKDILNERVKHREPFRPFACSVLLEEASKYFDTDVESPFMLLVVPVREDEKNKIPAVTHIDGTCRIQTVTRRDNGRYYNLINEFYKLTNVPLILNTSFNVAGEPIVETPADAIKCFLGTEIDYLVLNDFLVEKI